MRLDLKQGARGNSASKLKGRTAFGFALHLTFLLALMLPCLQGHQITARHEGGEIEDVPLCVQTL